MATIPQNIINDLRDLNQKPIPIIEMVGVSTSPIYLSTIDSKIYFPESTHTVVINYPVNHSKPVYGILAKMNKVSSKFDMNTHGLVVTSSGFSVYNEGIVRLSKMESTHGINYDYTLQNDPHFSDLLQPRNIVTELHEGDDGDMHDEEHVIDTNSFIGAKIKIFYATQSSFEQNGEVNLEKCAIFQSVFVKSYTVTPKTMNFRCESSFAEKLKTKIPVNKYASTNNATSEYALSRYAPLKFGTPSFSPISNTYTGSNGIYFGVADESQNIDMTESFEVAIHRNEQRIDLIRQVGKPLMYQEYEDDEGVVQKIDDANFHGDGYTQFSIGSGNSVRFPISQGSANFLSNADLFQCISTEVPYITRKSNPSDHAQFPYQGFTAEFYDDVNGLQQLPQVVRWNFSTISTSGGSTPEGYRDGLGSTTWTTLKHNSADQLGYGWRRVDRTSGGSLSFKIVSRKFPQINEHSLMYRSTHIDLQMSVYESWTDSTSHEYDSSEQSSILLAFKELPEVPYNTNNPIQYYPKLYESTFFPNEEWSDIHPVVLDFTSEGLQEEQESDIHMKAFQNGFKNGTHFDIHIFCSHYLKIFSISESVIFNLDGLSTETGLFAKTVGHKLDDMPEYEMSELLFEHPVPHIAWIWKHFMEMDSMGFDDTATQGVMQFGKYSINSPDIIPSTHAVTLDKQQNITKYTQKMLENTNAFPLIINDEGVEKFGVFVIKDTFIGNETQYDFRGIDPDFIKLSSKLTSLQKIATKVSVNYGGVDGNLYGENIYKTQSVDVTDFFPEYKLGFYGIDDDESRETVLECPYITNESDANNYRDWYVKHHCNQKIVIKMTLPLKYIDIHLGTIVWFEELPYDLRLLGIDYNLAWYGENSDPTHDHFDHGDDHEGDDDEEMELELSSKQTRELTINGQFFLPYFVVTSLELGGDEINVTCEMLMHLDHLHLPQACHQGVCYIDPMNPTQYHGCMLESAINYNPLANTPMNEVCIFNEVIEHVPPAFIDPATGLYKAGWMDVRLMKNKFIIPFDEITGNEIDPMALNLDFLVAHYNWHGEVADYPNVGGETGNAFRRMACFPKTMISKGGGGSPYEMTDFDAYSDSNFQGDGIGNFNPHIPLWQFGYAEKSEGAPALDGVVYTPVVSNNMLPATGIHEGLIIFGGAEYEISDQQQDGTFVFDGMSVNLGTWNFVGENEYVRIGKHGSGPLGSDTGVPLVCVSRRGYIHPFQGGQDWNFIGVAFDKTGLGDRIHNDSILKFGSHWTWDSGADADSHIGFGQHDWAVSVFRIWNLTDTPIPVPCMEGVYEKTFDSNDDPSTYPEFYWEQGDANMDGHFNILDVVAYVLHIIGDDLMTEEEIGIADMNDDGIVDITDLALFLVKLTDAEWTVQE